MRENGLNGRRRGKFIPAAGSKHGLEVCGNLPNREFHAGQGGEKWAADITYLRTQDGWVYLTVVLGIERRYGDMPYDYPRAGHSVQESAGASRPVISC
jgi:putative transposase